MVEQRSQYRLVAVCFDGVKKLAPRRQAAAQSIGARAQMRQIVKIGAYRLCLESWCPGNLFLERLCPGTHSSIEIVAHVLQIHCLNTLTRCCRKWVAIARRVIPRSSPRMNMRTSSRYQEAKSSGTRGSAQNILLWL